MQLMPEVLAIKEVDEQKKTVGNEQVERAHYNCTVLLYCQSYLAVSRAERSGCFNPYGLFFY